MLKQVYNKEQLLKTLTPSDVKRWDVLSNYQDVETAISNTITYWEKNKYCLSSITTKTIKSKTVYIPSKMEDAFAIKLTDRFIRKIYKVQQADRNKIVRQLKIFLEDQGDYHIFRTDIKNCYESIGLDSLIAKLENDSILAPRCIDLIKNLHHELSSQHNFSGLPRGLSISSTLAELYLENIDHRIVTNKEVLFYARYVDDIIIIIPSISIKSFQGDLTSIFQDYDLEENNSSEKKYTTPIREAKFEFLGYTFTAQKNSVHLTISNSKINKIKERIVRSFIAFKLNHNENLLKSRIEFLSMLKVVKKGKNGDLLAGLAYNYGLVTDGFNCLKELDLFFLKQIYNTAWGLSNEQKERLKIVSFYGNAINKKVANFSKVKAKQITEIWKNV